MQCQRYQPSRRDVARDGLETPLDAPPAWWPEERWPNWRHENVRDVILHVMTETACHAGHLDVVRELIDGRTWMVVTG